MIDTIFTIGYSGFSLDEFVETLQQHEISLVIDVRSHPVSQYFTDYNKPNLEIELKQKGIYYRNYAKEFGVRQENRVFYAETGYFDFEKFSESENFLSGFNKLTKSMEKGYRLTLMCAEKDPMNCHRTILVARFFHQAGYKIIHIEPDSFSETQEDIEKRLLEKYFPDRNQFSLFEPNRTEAEYIALAYKKCNAEIGYKIEDENG